MKGLKHNQSIKTLSTWLHIKRKGVDVTEFHFKSFTFEVLNYSLRIVSPGLCGLDAHQTCWCAEITLYQWWRWHFLKAQSTQISSSFRLVMPRCQRQWLMWTVSGGPDRKSKRLFLFASLAGRWNRRRRQPGIIHGLADRRPRKSAGVAQPPPQRTAAAF